MILAHYEKGLSLKAKYIIVAIIFLTNDCDVLDKKSGCPLADEEF